VHVSLLPVGIYLSCGNPVGRRGADENSLWIPLKPLEEETDPEKAQKLEEMITILRVVSPTVFH
jgi:hypothetical protein